LAFGTLLLPGGVLLIYIVHATRPPRGIAVTDHGAALVEKSFWNGRPSKLLAWLPPGGPPLLDGPGGSTQQIVVGPDTVTFRRAEADRLRSLFVPS
jgi:hypothetical protein